MSTNLDPPPNAPEPAPRDELDRILAETLDTEILAACVLNQAHATQMTQMNPGCRALFSLNPDTPVADLAELICESDRNRLRERLEAFFADPQEVLRLSFQSPAPTGELLDIELYAVPAQVASQPHALAFMFDITERRRHEEQLTFLAFLDPLTGLPNRAMFLDRLRETLILARENSTVFAVLQADLDGGFKAINDQYGHAAGDLLLNVVAERLANCVRGQDVVARQGGDEFALLLPHITRLNDVEAVAERIIREVSAPIPVGGSTVQVGISIGIALYPEHAADIDTLLSLADRAMYASKAAGRNRYTLAEKTTGHQCLPVEFLNWNENNAVGIEMIDSQHQALVSLINRLGDELKNGRSRIQLLATFQELVHYTEFHFAAEEGLMRDAGIQSLDVHHQKHQQLLEDIRQFGQDLDHRSMALTMRYLQEWLVRHIDTMDKGLGRLLRSQGLS